MIPLLDVPGNEGATAVAQIEEGIENTGVTAGVTVIVIVALVTHTAAAGVKV